MLDEERREEQGGDEEEAPFDADPPIDPSVARVGNSRARFVLPSDEAAAEGEGATEEPEAESAE